MDEIRITIQNRSDQDLSILVEEVQDAKGIAFVMHGLGGFKEQPHIQVMADALREAGYSTIRFDAWHTLSEGAPESRLEDARLSNYLSDLEDVIAWAHEQEWYQEPFVLMGHSLGAMACVFYAQQHPEQVYGVAPIATVVSGSLSSDLKTNLEDWRASGFQITPSTSRPGVQKRVGWGFMEELQGLNLLTDAQKISMPILLIVGSEDSGTPPEHQQMLFDAVSGKRELHVINGASHNFRLEGEREQLKRFVTAWAEKL